MTDRNNDATTSAKRPAGIMAGIRAIGLAWFILIFLLFMEGCILFFNYEYERSVAPEGVTMIWGLTAFGAALLLFEGLRIPLAFWAASFKSRVARYAMILLILVLCLPTWFVMKDMVTNQFLASLNPSNEVTQQADRLAEENLILEGRILTIRNDSDEARMQIDRIRATTDAKSSAISERRTEVEGQWQKRIDEMEDSHFLTTAESAEIKQVQDEIAALETRSEKDGVRLEQQLERSEARLETARSANLERHASEMVAWDRETESLKAAYQSEMAAWNAGQSSRREAIREATKRHDEMVDSMRARIKTLEEARDLEIARLREEDASKTFGNWSLDSDIEKVEKKCAARVEKIEAEIRDLKAPEEMISAHARPVMPELPNRPTLMEVDTSEVDRTVASIEGLGAKLASGTQPLRTRIAAIRDAASKRANDVMDALNEQRRDLVTQRDAALARLDEELAAVQQDRNVEIVGIKGAVMDQAAILETIESSRATIHENEQTITVLRGKAITLREKTDIHMMSASLEYWMPESTEAERDQAVLGLVMPLFLMILIPIPPVLIELIVGRAVKSLDAPEHAKQRRFLTICGLARRGVALSRSRRDREIARTSQTMASEMDAIKAEASRTEALAMKQLEETRERSQQEIAHANRCASEMIDEQLTRQDQAVRDGVLSERERLTKAHERELSLARSEASAAAERAKALEKRLHTERMDAQKKSLETQKKDFEEKMAIETNAATQCLQAKSELEMVKARYGLSGHRGGRTPEMN